MRQRYLFGFDSDLTLWVAGKAANVRVTIGHFGAAWHRALASE